MLFLAFTLTIIQLGLFCLERAALELAREIALPFKFTSVLLPRWYKLSVRAVFLMKWTAMIDLWFSSGWIIPLALIVADFAAAAILPIPYGICVFFFERRISEIAVADAELASALSDMLSKADFCGNRKIAA